MSILKFNGKANPNASAENVKYITREKACADISFYNLDELKADSLTEARSNAIAYAETRKDIESRQPPPPRGIARNHHRMVLSFDRNETTENARDQAQQFLKENFTDARAIVAIHQDKAEMTHAHVWIDCRTRELDKRSIEKKLQIDKATYKSLDERWARQYDRTYGTDYEHEYKEKKDETREWKRDRVAGIDRKKPTRARDGMTADSFREKDLRDSGVEQHELIEKRIDRNKFIIAAGQRCITDTHKQIDSGEREVTKFEHEFRETLAASKRLQHTVTGMDRANKRAAERANIDRELSR
jgi:hypothetical protein